MPSSSTGLSSQEGRLLYCHQVSYARLWYAFRGRSDTLDFVQEEFSDALDLPDDVFQREWYDRDQKWWLDMRDYCLSKPRHENVRAAGSALLDAGACLFQFGRVREAQKFCQWGHDLLELARDLEQSELEFGG